MKYKNGIIFYLLELANRMGYEHRSWYIRLAIEEAFTNALFYGNHGDTSKKISIYCSIDHKRFEISVEDEGDGFDWKSLSKPDSEAESGRGIFLIKSFMDKVEFNEKGNRITMVKYK